MASTPGTKVTPPAAPSVGSILCQDPAPGSHTFASREPVDVSQVVRSCVGFVRDWLPVVIVLFGYDAIHNRLGGFLPAAHTFPQIRADEALFGTPIPTLRMQQAFYAAANPRWWDYASLAIYTSHFVVPIAIALALWIRSRERYLRFLTWFVGLTTLAYLTYIVYPAVPPWLASQRGALAPTHRLVRELWEHLGRHTLAGLFSGTNVYANDVAAIPSLHAAYPLMTAIFFWKGRRALMKVLLVLYASSMAVVLVYSGEHYVVDIMLGWLYVSVTAFVMQRLFLHRLRAPIPER